MCVSGQIRTPTAGTVVTLLRRNGTRDTRHVSTAATACCMVACHSSCWGSTYCVPTVIWEPGDDEYQLLFCFCFCFCCPLSEISIIRNLDQFFSFRSYHPLSGPPCHLAGHIFLCQAVPAISDLNGGAFAQTHNSHCQCQCSWFNPFHLFNSCRESVIREAAVKRRENNSELGKKTCRLSSCCSNQVEC